MYYEHGYIVSASSSSRSDFPTIKRCGLRQLSHCSRALKRCWLQTAESHFLTTPLAIVVNDEVMRIHEDDTGLKADDMGSTGKQDSSPACAKDPLHSVLALVRSFSCSSRGCSGELLATQPGPRQRLKIFSFAELLGCKRHMVPKPTL